MRVTADQIRKIREKTGAPVMRIKRLLEDLNGDEKRVEEILTKEGFEKASERADRVTNQGLIEAYVHHSGKIVGVVELLCETDFVAKNRLFKDLAHDLSLQVASMGEKNFEDQEFIKDPSKKVGDLIKELIAKTGENIRIGRILRLELGKE